MKRFVGPILGLLVLAGVGFAIWNSAANKSRTDAAALSASQRITVRVVSGSEKLNLLKDERLVKLLATKGIALEVQKAGSREIATLPDLKSYDVAFPAGQPAAEKIRINAGARKIATAFATPMVIASWKPIAEILMQNGIVQKEAGAYWVIDMGKLLNLMESGRRWRDLPGNTAFAVGKSVLVSTTNVSTSNSAAQFLALASYLFNGAEVVTTGEQADAAALKVAPLFARQGYQESSSSGPFEDYLSIGMGKTPMVWIYEAQFLEQAIQRQVKPDMVILYPRPAIFTKHVMVSLSTKGDRFLDAMADPEALAIAADYGYRSEGSAAFEHIKSGAKAKGLVLPDLVDLVDAPGYDLLERMIVTIESTRDVAVPPTRQPARLPAPESNAVPMSSPANKEKEKMR